jgi:hypothetical protein
MTVTLTQTRILNGWWEGVLTGFTGSAPEVVARHQGAPLDGVEVVALSGRPDQASVRLPIPATVLSEGVQTVILEADGLICGQFTLIAGVPLEEDLRAELSLLRAELDLLKRAFRRHCAETEG